MLASLGGLGRFGLMQPRSGDAARGQGGEELGVDPLRPGRGFAIARGQLLNMKHPVSAVSATQQVV